MTTGAGGGDGVVIEVDRGPAGGGMAVATVVGTGDVSRVLAWGGSAVVAGEAGADHGGVFNPLDRFPGPGGMAFIALPTAGDMIVVLSSRCFTVMTALAIR